MAWGQPFWCLCDVMLTWEDVPNSKQLLRRCPQCGQVWAWDDYELYPEPIDLVHADGSPADFNEVPVRPNAN